MTIKICFCQAIFLAFISLTFVEPLSGQTFRQQGARRGAVAGAVLGGIIGAKNDRPILGIVAGGVTGSVIGKAIGQRQDDQLNRQYYGYPGYGNPRYNRSFHSTPPPYPYSHLHQPGYYHQPVPGQLRQQFPHPSSLNQPFPPALAEPWPSSLNQTGSTQQVPPQTPLQSSPSPTIAQQYYVEEPTPSGPPAEKNNSASTRPGQPTRAVRSPSRGQAENQQSAHSSPTHRSASGANKGQLLQGQLRPGTLQSGQWTPPAKLRRQDQDDSVLIPHPSHPQPNQPYRHGW